MVFSSILFLFRFLPIAFLVYYLMPKRLKNFSLIVLSMVFYSWGEVKYFPIMLASIVVDYIASLGIERNRDKRIACKLFLLFSIFFNLGMLIFFKYTNFFVDNINFLFNLDLAGINLTLPLGISFYTFQTMSYTIDVYKNKVKAEKNIIDFGAFVVLFPQLIAGPIVKYTDINEELKTREISFVQIQDGIITFIWGLGSKVLIANSVGSLWTQTQELGFANISTGLAWLSILAFSLQIYFDFSGYSLMAIGLGKMLGFNFPQNFNYPYISKSFTEFWRRWHMTLGSWFREYLYIPLGGNRKGQVRLYINLLIVWSATGFWHGASWNFLLWGLFFFVFLSIEKVFLLPYLEKSMIFSRVYVIFFLILSWALFAIEDFTMLSTFFTKMFVFEGGIDFIYYFRNYGVIIIVACVFSTPFIKNIYAKLPKVIQYIGMFAVMIVSVAYLVDATYNPFLYFRF